MREETVSTENPATHEFRVDLQLGARLDARLYMQETFAKLGSRAVRALSRVEEVFTPHSRTN